MRLLRALLLVCLTQLAWTAVLDCSTVGTTLNHEVCHYDSVTKDFPLTSVYNETVVVFKDHIKDVLTLPTLFVDASLLVFDLCDVDLSGGPFVAPKLNTTHVSQILVYCGSVAFQDMIMYSGEFHARGGVSTLQFTGYLAMYRVDIYSLESMDLYIDPTADDQEYPSFETMFYVYRTHINCTAAAPLSYVVQGPVNLTQVYFHSYGSSNSGCLGDPDWFPGASLTLDLSDATILEYDVKEITTQGGVYQSNPNWQGPAGNAILILKDNEVPIPTDTIWAYNGIPRGHVDVYRTEGSPSFTRYITFSWEWWDPITSSTCPSAYVFDGDNITCLGPTDYIPRFINFVIPEPGAVTHYIDTSSATYRVDSIEAAHRGTYLHFVPFNGSTGITVQFGECHATVSCDNSDYFILTNVNLSAHENLDTSFPETLQLIDAQVTLPLTGVKKLELLSGNYQWYDIDAPDLEEITLKGTATLTVAMSNNFGDIAITLKDSSLLYFDGNTIGSISLLEPNLECELFDNSSVRFSGTVALEGFKFTLNTGTTMDLSGTSITLKDVQLDLESGSVLKLFSGTFLDNTDIILKDGVRVEFEWFSSDSFVLQSVSNQVEFDGNVVISSGIVTMVDGQFIFYNVDIVVDNLTFQDVLGVKFEDGFRFSGRIRDPLGQLLDAQGLQLVSPGSFEFTNDGYVIMNGTLEATRFAPSHSFVGSFSSVNILSFVFNDGTTTIALFYSTDNITGDIKVSSNSLSFGSASWSTATIVSGEIQIFHGVEFSLSESSDVNLSELKLYPRSKFLLSDSASFTARVIVISGAYGGDIVLLSIEDDSSLQLDQLSLYDATTLTYTSTSALRIKELTVTQTAVMTIHDAKLISDIVNITNEGSIVCIERCEFEVDGRLVLDSTSTITAVGTSTLIQDCNGSGSSPVLGGNHAGCGGQGGCAQDNDAVNGGSYGNALFPTFPGSRCDSTVSGDVSTGGGVIIVNAGTLEAYGKIDASARKGSHDDYRGGAAGGSILITATNIVGSNLRLVANGADATSGDASPVMAHGGSGGRIAVHVYPDNLQNASITYEAFGGLGAYAGGNGSMGTILQPYRANLPLLRSSFPGFESTFDMFPTAYIETDNYLPYTKIAVKTIMGPIEFVPILDGSGDAPAIEFCYVSMAFSNLMLHNEFADFTVERCDSNLPAFDSATLSDKFAPVLSTHVTQLAARDLFHAYRVNYLPDVIPTALASAVGGGWNSAKLAFFRSAWEGVATGIFGEKLTYGWDLVNELAPYTFEQLLETLYLPWDASDDPDLYITRPLDTSYTTDDVDSLAAATDPYIPYVLGDQDIQLSLDLWAVKNGETTPFQRGVPMAKHLFHIGATAGDERKVDPNYQRPPLYTFSEHNEYGISGVQVAIASVTWTLYGVPSPEFRSLADTSEMVHNVDAPHIVEIQSETAFHSVPAGSLIPGYIYHVTATSNAMLSIASTRETYINSEPVTIHTRAFGILYVHLPPVVNLNFQLSPMVTPNMFDQLFDLSTAQSGDSPFFEHVKMDSAYKYDLLLATSVDFFEYQPRLQKVWKHLTEVTFDYATFSTDLATMETDCATELANYSPDMGHDALRSHFLAQVAGDVTAWCQKKSIVFDDYVAQFDASYSVNDEWTYTFLFESEPGSTFASLVANPTEYAAQQLLFQDEANWPAGRIASDDSSVGDVTVSLLTLEESRAYLNLRFYVLVKDSFGTFSISALELYSIFDISSTKNDMLADLQVIMDLLEHLETVEEADLVDITRLRIMEYYWQVHNKHIEAVDLTNEEHTLNVDLYRTYYALTVDFVNYYLENEPDDDPSDPTVPVTNSNIFEAVRNVYNAIDHNGSDAVYKLGQFNALKDIFDVALPRGFRNSNPNVNLIDVDPFPVNALQLALDSLEQLQLGVGGAVVSESEFEDFFRSVTRAVLRNVEVSNGSVVMTPSFIANNANDYEITIGETASNLPSFIFSTIRVLADSAVSIEIPQPDALCNSFLDHPSCVNPPTVTLPAELFPDPSGTYDIIVVQMRNPGLREDEHNIQQAPPDIPITEDAENELFEFLSNDFTNDLFAELGLASRVVSFKIYDSTGNEVPIVDLDTPFTFTLPYDGLEDFESAVVDLVSTKPAALRFVCPTTDVVPITEDDLSIELTIGYETLTVVKSGSLPSNDPDYFDTAFAVLRRDCGEVFGFHEFICLLDSPKEYIHQCPQISEPAPVCMFWDSDDLAWSDEGCTVVSSTASSVTCECDHMTSFSARFRAYAQPSKSIFSARRPFPSNRSDVNVFVGLTLSLLFVGWVFLGTSDRSAARLFVKYLHQDKEVQFLRHLAETSGRRFVLDRIQDTWRYAFGSQEPNASLPGAPDVGPLPAAEYMTPAHGSDTTAAIEHAVVASNGSANPAGAALYALFSSNLDQCGIASASSQAIVVDASSESTESVAIATKHNVPSSFMTSAKDILNVLSYKPPSSGVSFSNYWVAKGLLFKLWFRRLIINHSWLSVLAPYDPKFTRSYRLLLFSIEFIGSLFFAMLYYNHVHADADGVLPSLSASDHFLLAFVVTLSQMAISLVLSFLLKLGAQERFERRYSALYEECRNRNLAETFLSQFTAEQLRDAAKQYLSELADKGDIVSGKDVVVDNKNSKIAWEAKEYDQSFFWMEAPKESAMGYASFSSFIARHPGQKAAYVQSQKKRAGGGVELTPNHLSDLLVFYNYRANNASLWTKIKAYFAPSTQFVDTHLHNSNGPFTAEALAATVEAALRNKKSQRFTFASVIENYFYVYCTPMNVIAMICAFTYLAWSVAYIIMFGLELSKADRMDFFGAWGINLFYSFFLKEPLLISLHFIFSFFLLPCWYSFLTYLQCVGLYVVRNPKASVSHIDTFSRRMEQLTIARATGATNGMTPSEAVVSFISPSTIASTLLHIETPSRGRKLSIIEASIASEKRELVVQTYMLSNRHVSKFTSGQ